jgi:hypothetical protein
MFVQKNRIVFGIAALVVGFCVSACSKLKDGEVQTDASRTQAIAAASNMPAPPPSPSPGAEGTTGHLAEHGEHGEHGMMNGDHRMGPGPIGGPMGQEPMGPGMAGRQHMKGCGHDGGCP